MTYRCPICGSRDPTAFMRCDTSRGDCPDGREPDNPYRPSLLPREPTTSAGATVAILVLWSILGGFALIGVVLFIVFLGWTTS